MSTPSCLLFLNGASCKCLNVGILTYHEVLYLHWDGHGIPGNQWKTQICDQPTTSPWSLSFSPGRRLRRRAGLVLLCQAVTPWSVDLPDRCLRRGAWEYRPPQLGSPTWWVEKWMFSWWMDCQRLLDTSDNERGWPTGIDWGLWKPGNNTRAQRTLPSSSVIVNIRALSGLGKLSSFWSCTKLPLLAVLPNLFWHLKVSPVSLVLIFWGLESLAFDKARAWQVPGGTSRCKCFKLFRKLESKSLCLSTIQYKKERRTWPSHEGPAVYNNFFPHIQV